MSKKSKKRVKGGATEPPLPAVLKAPSKRKRLYVAALCAVALTAAVAAATRYDPVRRAVGLKPLLAAQGSGGLPLAKEYIYSGGRLIATEEPAPSATPTPTPSGSAPTNLVATAAFPSGVANVGLTWGAPSSGPTVVSYVVERRGAGTAFQQIATVQEPTRSYNDTGVALNSAYLYRVSAVFSNAGTSDYSNQDLATAVAYSDDPLVAGVTTVKAAHLTQMRAAVDAVRALAGVGAASWQTNPSPAPGGSILAAHSVELRSNLNPALSALGVTQMPSDSTLAVGLPVKAAHIQDVREKVR